jgi:hypothetical protein
MPVPFRRLEWHEKNGDWVATPDLLDETEPKPELRQDDSENFVILRSFCYLVPEHDPQAGTIYVIPGEDGPAPWSDTTRDEHDGHPVVIPPNPKSGQTDLASVPWFMWWLVATYGNHTRAVLFHDSLIVDEGEPPVARTAADRLLLTALREPDQTTGVFRHWLMWAAVSTFGTMKKLGAVLSAHVLLIWGLLAAALVKAWGPTIWSWGPSIWPDGWDPVPWVPDWLWNTALILAGTLVALRVFLTALGGAWRAGRRNTGGWLIPIAALAALIVVLLWLERPWSLDLQWSPFNLLVSALLLLLNGPVWGAGVDRSLWGWLWPTALIGLPVAAMPLVLIFASVYLVRAIDRGAARVRALQKDETGARIGYDEPDVKPSHFPI